MYVLCEANPPVLRTRLFMSEHVCMYTKYTCRHASALVLWDVALFGHEFRDLFFCRVVLLVM